MNLIVEGQGPVVVLSHALALDGEMWIDVAALLAKRFTIVRYNHRGHGSDQSNQKPFTIADLADEAALIIRQITSSPAVFVGLSLGGMVGQALAARHPGLLRGLAILNSTSFYPDRSTWDARMQAVRDGGMSAIASSSLDRWLSAAFRDTLAGKAVEFRLRECLLDMSPQAYLLACDAIAGMDLREGNASISTSTLVVAGRYDQATPLEMSTALRNQIRNSRLAVVNAAHISAAEAPEELALLLEEWIATLPSIGEEPEVRC